MKSRKFFRFDGFCGAVVLCLCSGSSEQSGVYLLNSIDFVCYQFDKTVNMLKLSGCLCAWLFSLGRCHLADTIKMKLISFAVFLGFLLLAAGGCTRKNDYIPRLGQLVRKFLRESAYSVIRR